MKFKNVDDNIVKYIIDKLVPKSRFGSDGISTKLVKTAQDALIIPVVTIITQMVNTGIFPDKLKIAKICPIHKRDDDTVFTNLTSACDLKICGRNGQE